jgi:hypothetical protein
MRKWISGHVSYANVVATMALFIALGGTGYAAITLPRDSVGARELRRDAVGTSEIRKDAVTSSAIRDRSIRLNDLSMDTRRDLAGAQGPAGPAGAPGPTGATGQRGEVGPPGTSPATFTAVIDSAGGRFSGTASLATKTAIGDYRVRFGRVLDTCTFAASLARVTSGPFVDPPPGGSITVGELGMELRVQTYDAAAAPRDSGFHLIVVCS